MSAIAAARRLVDELVRAGKLEVRRAETVGRDLGTWLEQLGRLPSGREIADWLQDHRLVDELLATEDALERAVEQHFAATSPAPTSGTEARNDELEQPIVESPGALDAIQVYSDWLQERGDPLGELIALGVAADGGGTDAKERFERALGKRREHFLGRFSSSRDTALRLTWQHGLVREVHVVEPLSAEAFRDLLGLRVLFAVQSIRLQGSGAVVLNGAESVAACFFPVSARSLCLEGFFDLDLATLRLPESTRALELRGHRLQLPASLPPLESLALTIEQFEPNTTSRSNASTLALGWTTAAPALLAALELPQLETLAIDLRGEQAALTKLVAFLNGDLSGLRHLRVTGGAIDATVVAALVTTPAARRFESLGLTGLCLGDEAIAELARHRSSLPALRRLDVSHNELGPAGLQAVRSLDVEIENRRQDARGTGMRRRIRRFAGTRFQVAEPLADATKWQQLGAEGDILWGHYEGTEPYELFVKSDLRDYGCSCPSSDQPCKHVVALALLATTHALPHMPWHRRVRSARRMIDPLADEL